MGSNGERDVSHKIAYARTSRSLDVRFFVAKILHGIQLGGVLSRYNLVIVLSMTVSSNIMYAHNL